MSGHRVYCAADSAIQHFKIYVGMLSLHINTSHYMTEDFDRLLWWPITVVCIVSIVHVALNSIQHKVSELISTYFQTVLFAL